MPPMIGSLMTSLGGSALGALGNTLGLSDMLGGGSSTDTAMQDTLDFQRKQMELQRGGMLNTNAMGQIGLGATVGSKVAMDSFGPSADMTMARNRALQGSSDIMSGNINQQNIAQQLAMNNLGRQEGQINNMSNLSGGPASALTQAAGALGQGNQQSLLAMLSQGGQLNNQAYAQANQMAGSAQDSFANQMQGKYQRDVTPYLNKWDNNFSSIAGIAPGVLNTSNNAEQNKMINNPLSGLSEGLGLMGNYGLTNQLAVNPDKGNAFSKDFLTNSKYNNPAYNPYLDPNNF